MKQHTIGFIGLGNMARAIIAGLRGSAAFEQADILGYDRNEDKRAAFEQSFGVRIAADACEVAGKADVLVLAVKPQGFDALKETIEGCLQPGQVLVSLAAGKPLAYFNINRGADLPVIRAMPNVNARASASMTAISYNGRVSKDQLERVVALFDAIGSVRVLEEEKMPAFNAIAGAGPAFAFAFIDALSTAGVRAGLPRAMAQQAASAMLIGSAKLVAESSNHPRALNDQVTSPGGPTIEGMHALSRLGFEHAVQEAVAAVIRKEADMQ